MAKRGELRFEWDPAKRDANLARHGIDFAEVTALFSGRQLLLRVDARKNYGKVRINVLGKLDSVVLHVTWTPRREVVRIISARRTRKDERENRRSYPDDS